MLAYVIAGMAREGQQGMNICSTGNSVTDAFEPKQGVCQEPAIPFKFYMTLVSLSALNP